MDWLQFIAAIVSASAWPVALVAVGLIFRHELQALFTRVREVRGPGGTSATFVDELEGAREMAGQVSLKADANEPHAPFYDKRFFELVEKYPEAAILYTYQEVNATIEAHWRRLWREGKSRAKTPLEFLQSIEGIDDATIHLYEQLQKTRDAAVHAVAGTITPGEAIEFKELSEVLIYMIERTMERMYQATKPSQ